MIQRWRDIFANRVVVGTDGKVGRIFVRCYDCQRVVPSWQLLKTNKTGVTGCKCGSFHVQPRVLSQWHAAWWVFVRSILIRKWILRAEQWDARIPWRAA